MPPIPPSQDEVDERRRFLNSRTKTLRELYEIPAGQWTKAYENLKNLEADLAKLPNTAVNATARKYYHRNSAFCIRTLCD